MRRRLIKSLLRLLREAAAISPLRLALWCLVIFALRDLVRSLVEFLRTILFMACC